MSEEGSRPQIYAAVAQASFAEHVDLIDVPKEGAPVVLLRTKRMPEYAFLVWAGNGGNTSTKMVFSGSPESQQGHHLVCCCCNPQTGGVKGAPLVESERLSWTKRLAGEFQASVVEACRSNGVQTFFARRVGWGRHIRWPDGLTGEITAHRRFLTDKYSGEQIDDALRFIDFERSTYLTYNPR